MTSPVLSWLDGLVHDLAANDLTAAEALARLRSRGYTPDRFALLEAVQVVHLRDDLIAGLADPVLYLGARPTAPLADVLQLAVDKAERELEILLLCMARPTRIARAS